MHLSRAAALHLEALPVETSPATIRLYDLVHRSLGLFLAEALGRTPLLRDLTVEHARAWQKALRDRGLSLTTVSNYSRIAKAWSSVLYAELQDDGVFPKGPPLGDLSAPRPDRKRPDTVSGASVQLLADLCATTREPLRNRAIVLLLADSGIRNAELTYLERGRLELGGRGEPGWVQVTKGKGGRQRLVGFGVATAKALRVYLELERGSETDQPWLFLSQAGGRLSTDTVRRLFRSLRVRAGLDRRAHPHALRHSYVREQTVAGIASLALMHQVGHATVSQTAHYAQALADDVKLTYSSPVDRVRARGSPSQQERRAGALGTPTRQAPPNAPRPLTKTRKLRT